MSWVGSFCPLTCQWHKVTHIYNWHITRMQAIPQPRLQDSFPLSNLGTRWKIFVEISIHSAGRNICNKPDYGLVLLRPWPSKNIRLIWLLICFNCNTDLWRWCDMSLLHTHSKNIYHFDQGLVPFHYLHISRTKTTQVSYNIWLKNLKSGAVREGEGWGPSHGAISKHRVNQDLIDFCFHVWSKVDSWAEINFNGVVSHFFKFKKWKKL